MDPPRGLVFLPRCVVVGGVNPWSSLSPTCVAECLPWSALVRARRSLFVFFLLDISLRHLVVSGAAFVTGCGYFRVLTGTGVVILTPTRELALQIYGVAHELVCFDFARMFRLGSSPPRYHRIYYWT